MIFAFIGMTVGIIMGLTGAGGAMISIPLFIILLDMSIKEATILSLVAVILGTAVSLVGQISRANTKIAVSFSAAGAITNYLSLPLKANTPEWLIAAILSLIGVFSIWSVWGKDSEQNIHTNGRHEILKALIAGSFLGLLTTLTGLGGGVILVPILIKFFGNDYEKALPTSLGTIFLIALTSFIFQPRMAFELINLTQLTLMASGALLAYVLLKILLKKVEEQKILSIRKFVFISVTIYSITSVIYKAM